MDLEKLLLDVHDTVEIKGNSYKVYPLSLEDFIRVFKGASAEMTALIDERMSVTQLVDVAPGLAARIMKAGFRSSSDEASFKRLPAGVQLTALEKIWRLSEIDVSFLGKLMAGLHQLTLNLRQAPKENGSPVEKTQPESSSKPSST